LAWVPSPRGDDVVGVWFFVVGTPTDDRGTESSGIGPLEAGKKGGLEPALTLPGIRRALQHLLLPLAKPDRAYCRSPHMHPQNE
jgi:hypothetical protein